MFLVCERAGSVIEDGQCVPCPANSYAGAGNTTCTECPTNSSTADVTGATSIIACGEWQWVLAIFYIFIHILNMIPYENYIKVAYG